MVEVHEKLIRNPHVIITLVKLGEDSKYLVKHEDSCELVKGRSMKYSVE